MLADSSGVLRAGPWRPGPRGASRLATATLALAATTLLAWGLRTQACEYTADMPQRVHSMRESILSTEGYSALAKEWQAYVDAHPDAALGYVYLYRAKRYLQQADQEEGLRLLSKALALEPQCPEVLSDLGSFECGRADRSNPPDYGPARGYAERAIALRPDWHEPHITLLTIAMRTGDAAQQTAQLQALVRKEAFAPQLLDFAHNLLVSAAPDAIILTNGDNDTFPTLALQSVYRVRPDVRIVNLSLLNLRTYAATVVASSAARPGPLTAAEIETLQKQAMEAKQPPMQPIVQALVQKVAAGTWKQPVYFACTVYPGSLKQLCTQPLTLEGLLYRVGSGARAAGPSSDEIVVNAVRTDSLLTHDFRLQSATQFGYAWDPKSSVAMLQWNYVSAWQRTATAYAEAGNIEAARRMLREGVAMLRAHPELRGTERDYLSSIVAYWKEIDPKNPEVDALQRELGK